MPTWTMDESTSVNHVLKRCASNTTVLKLADIPREPWRFHTFGGEVGLSYHQCRFCDRGIESLSGLWKYAVRHYACEDCRRHFAHFAGVLKGHKKSS